MLTPSSLSYQPLNQHHQQNESTHIDRDQQPTEFRPSYQQDPMQNTFNPSNPSNLPYPTVMPENSVSPYPEHQDGKSQDPPPPYPINQNGPWHTAPRGVQK